MNHCPLAYPKRLVGDRDGCLLRKVGATAFSSRIGEIDESMCSGAGVKAQPARHHSFTSRTRLKGNPPPSQTALGRIKINDVEYARGEIGISADNVLGQSNGNLDQKNTSKMRNRQIRNQPSEWRFLLGGGMLQG